MDVMFELSRIELQKNSKRVLPQTCCCFRLNIRDPDESTTSATTSTAIVSTSLSQFSERRTV